jgi:coproporphyrinogen III oxidase-like Fe-S oxidoreductase
MLWFERTVLAVLRREYPGPMPFDEDDVAEVMPAPPPVPCRLAVRVPFCEVLCPLCPFHRRRCNEPGTARCFEALCGEIRPYHDAGFRFGEVCVAAAPLR